MAQRDPRQWGPAPSLLSSHPPPHPLSIKPTTHPRLLSLLLVHKKLARTHTTTNNTPLLLFLRPLTTATDDIYQLVARVRRRRCGRHGEVPVLREGAHQQGRLDQGGGPAPHRLHQGPWRRLLEIPPKSRRVAAVREELQAALDQLPQARPQAGKLHRGGGRAHHQAPRAARQQVVAHRREAAGQDGQRDQELLEHAHQAQAPGPRHGPAHPPPAQCHRGGRHAAPAAAASTPLRCCSSRWPPPPAGSLRGYLHLRRAGLQPQQRRRRAGRLSHSAAAAATTPRHRPQPLHQPRALPACRRPSGETGSGEPQCNVHVGGVPVLEPPRFPGRRQGMRLRRRRLLRAHAAAAAAGSG